jgi:DNA-binding MarR family transcriptional regulator
MSAAVNPETVADRLNSAMIHLLRRAAREDVAAGIGPAQLSALSVLVFGGAATLGALADAEHVRAPTMTRIVAALEQAGLVRKEPGREDRRQGAASCSAHGSAGSARSRPAWRSCRRTTWRPSPARLSSWRPQRAWIDGVRGHAALE